MQSGSADARPSSKTGMMPGQGERAACPEGIPGCDLRRGRYIGVVKIRLERILIAAWLTLRRIGEWFADTQRVRTRIVSFVTLARAGT